jgi:RimJ/RimL family protein N-acetyltransferase
MAVIETARLRLRPFASGDVAEVFAHFGDPEIRRWLPRAPHPYRLENAATFVASRADAERRGAEVSRVIELDGALVGAIGWRMTDHWDGLPEGTPNVGFWLAKNLWGRGYMTEAARAVCAHLFDDLGHVLIASGAFEANVASLAIQARLGFRPVSRAVMFAPIEGRELPLVRTSLARDAFARG